MSTVEKKGSVTTDSQIKEQEFYLSEQPIKFKATSNMKYYFLDQISSKCSSYEDILEVFSINDVNEVSTKGEILLCINENKHYAAIILLSNETILLDDSFCLNSSSNEFTLIDFSKYLNNTTGNKSDLQNAYVCAGVESQGLIFILLDDNYGISDIDISSLWGMFDFPAKKNTKNHIEGLE